MLVLLAILSMISFVVFAAFRAAKSHISDEFEQVTSIEPPQESVCLRTLEVGYKALQMKPGLAQAAEFEKFVATVRELGGKGETKSNIRRVK